MASLQQIFKYNYSISIVLTSSKTGTQNQLVVNVIYVNLKDVSQFFFGKYILFSYNMLYKVIMYVGIIINP